MKFFRQVEILTGDVGTVRNQLQRLLEEKVGEIVSLTQTVTPDGQFIRLTIVLIYFPQLESEV